MPCVACPMIPMCPGKGLSVAEVKSNRAAVKKGLRNNGDYLNRKALPSQVVTKSISNNTGHRGQTSSLSPKTQLTLNGTEDNMQISASMVKELRDRTGAGMMDCKKALQETAGDIEAAIDAMRKSGMAKAAKKAGRIAAEGIIVIKSDGAGGNAVILEVNCETDFVARDDSFQGFSGNLAGVLLEQGNGAVEAPGDLSLNGAGSQSVEEARQQLVTRLGENISVRRYSRVRKGPGGGLGIYVHGTRIGVIVDLSVDNPALAKDLAMHIAAANPLSVDEKDMPADLLDREREIQLAQAGESGKPEAIIEKMVDGRMKKFLRENTLSGQAFVKDPDFTVAELLKKNNAAVNGFVRYEVGEGLEKKEDNFAAEVMQQAGLAGE